MYAAVAVLVSTAIAACSSPGISTPEPAPRMSLPAVDRSASSEIFADMDASTGEVSLPMDKYWYTEQENVYVNSAVAFLIEDCVEAEGHTMVSWSGEGKGRQDLRYGQWSASLAAKNGQMPEIWTVPGVREKTSIAISPSDEKAYELCTTSVGRAGFPELLPGLANDPSVQNRIVQDAAALTEQDTEYLVYRDAWLDCITSKGLKTSEDESWNLTVAGSKEEEIRTELLNVECKEKSGGSSTPYDINARYQATMMKDNQAVLNELVDKKTAAVERARDVLREHGVADAKL